MINAAARSVPASIRSGMTCTCAGRSSRTPSTVMIGVPAPSMCAPILPRTVASAITSGSRAQFSSTLRPSASTAAMSRFSVPVTVGRSKTNFAPRNFCADASTYPCVSSMRAPSAARPFRCWSMGRAPMAQPPGSETRARPSRASSGPSTRTDARIVLTSSYGASGRGSSEASTSSVCPPFSGSRATFAPMCESSRPMVRMSARSGTSRKTLRPGASSAAAICGRVAFFDPLTSTSPFSGTPPSISIASIRKAPSAQQHSTVRARCRERGGRGRPDP